MTTPYAPSPGSTDLLPQRTVAQVVDWMITVPVLFAIDLWLRSVGARTLLVFWTLAAVVFIVYGAVLEGFWQGRTVGKAIIDVKVVGEDGQECTPRQALVRNLPALLVPAVFVYVVALVSMVGTDLNQRVFDQVAETAVVRT